MKQLIYLILLFPSLISAQGVDNLWRMGYENFSGPPLGGVNIDFNSGAPVISYHLRVINYDAISATICDTTGRMLFTTNGVYIVNSNEDTMMNGSGLSPSYFTTSVADYGSYIPQAALIIPFPNDPQKYYLFHNTIDDSVAYSYKMYYSIIDMTLDGGLGAVTSKNNILKNDTLIPGGLTATRHGNGRDWWIVFHQAFTNLYYVYLIDPLGIHPYPSQQIGVNISFDAGQFCFSPDGSKLAQYGPYNDLDIMDFDRCSGILSNSIHVSINDSAAGGGVAFSLNSQVLYASSTSYIYQFDLNAANVASSKTTVAIWDTTYSPSPPFATTFYLAQLAPDGKIYLSCTNSTLDLHRIEYPDSLGLACQVCQHCVHLPAYNAYTIPNMPNYHLGPLDFSICDTITTTVHATEGKNQFDLFPNPARNKIYISTSKNNLPEHFSIYNMMGEQMSMNSNAINNGEYLEVDLSSLAPGIYIVEEIMNGEKFLKKLVKE